MLEVTLQLESDAAAATSRHGAQLDVAFDRAQRLHESLLRDLCGMFFQNRALKVVATVLQSSSLNPSTLLGGGDGNASVVGAPPSVESLAATGDPPSVSSPGQSLSTWHQVASTQVLVAAMLSAPAHAHLPNVVFALQRPQPSSEHAIARAPSTLSLRPLESVLGAPGLVAVRRALIGRATPTWSRSPKCQLDDVSALTALATGQNLAAATTSTTTVLSLPSSLHVHETEEERVEPLVNEDLVVALLSSAADASNGQQLRLSPFRGPLAHLIAVFLRLPSPHDDIQTKPSSFSSSSASTSPKLESVVGSAALRAASARYAIHWAQNEAPNVTTGTKDSADVDVAWNATLVSLIRAFSLPATGRKESDETGTAGSDNSISLESGIASWVLKAALTQHLAIPSANKSSKGEKTSSNSIDGGAILKLMHWLRTTSAQSVLETAATTVLATLSDLCAEEASAQASRHSQRAISSLWSLLWTDEVVHAQSPGTITAESNIAFVELKRLSNPARQLVHVASLEVVRSCLAKVEQQQRQSHPPLTQTSQKVKTSLAAVTDSSYQSEPLPLLNYSEVASLLALIDGPNGLLWANFVSWVAMESAQAATASEVESLKV